jgi:drug/metabolite transporter (DMT)-like permease
MQHLGEFAAFGTAICWTASAIFFERSAKRVGALAVNFYKVAGALVLLAVTGALTRGMPLPLDAPAKAWIYLPISGIVGFVIADYFLFNSYILVGSRRATLFQPLSPLFAAALGYLVLGEKMRPQSLVGMGLVVAGIFIALATRRKDDAAGNAVARPSAAVVKGLLFALGSAFFNAVGLIFSKLGLGDYDAVSGTEIRVMTAVVGFGLQALLFGEWKDVFVRAPRDAVAVRNTSIGTVFGPFLGVVLSLLALQHTSAGATSTLSSLTPVLIIFPTVFVMKQKVRAGEVVGAVVAVAGAALFFML